MALLAKEFIAINAYNKRVAIYNVEDGESPIPSHDAQKFIDDFTTALQQEFQNQWQFVARQDIQKIINENQEFNYMPFDVLINNLKADILIKPTINIANDGILFSAQAYTPAGQSLLKTRAFFIPYQFQAQIYPLDAAIKIISENLLQQIGDIDHINPLALHYQVSGAQTDFSRYVMQRIMTHIKQRYHHINPNNRQSQNDQLNASLFEWDSDRVLLEQRKRHYNLKGNYWISDNYISLNITLDGIEKSARAHVNIDINSIPQNFNYQPQHILANSDDIFSRGKFTLTSNKGKNPSYAIGESGQLIIVTGQDLYFYCFNIVVKDNNISDIVKIFPNHWHENNLIRKGKPQYIPDNTMDFAFIAEPPMGRQEFIRCYGYHHDINDLLTENMRQNSSPAPIINIYDIKNLDDYMDNITTQKPLKQTITLNILN